MNSVNAGILSAIIFAMVGTFHLGAYFTGEGIKVAEYAVNLFSVSPSAETVELPNYNGSGSDSSIATLSTEDGHGVQPNQPTRADRCQQLGGYYDETTKCCNWSSTTYFCDGFTA